MGINTYMKKNKKQFTWFTDDQHMIVRGLHEANTSCCRKLQLLLAVKQFWLSEIICPVKCYEPAAYSRADECFVIGYFTQIIVSS